MQLSNSIVSAICHVNLHKKTLKLITLKYNEAWLLLNNWKDSIFYLFDEF